MTDITSGKRKAKSPSDGDSVLSQVLRYAALAVIDAFALIIIYTLFFAGNVGLGAIISIAAIGANVIVLVPGLAPLRWMLPGLVLVTILVIYPIFYTVYTAFTNYGDGHLLTKQQATTLILNRRESLYVPSDAITYSWTLFQAENDADQFALWLSRTNDEGEPEVAFAPLDGEIIDLEVDDAEAPETYDGYVRLERRDLARVLSTVQSMIFGEGDDTAGIRTTAEAARPLEKRFTYDEDRDALIDQESGIVYTANEVEGSYEPQPFDVRYDESANEIVVVETGTRYPVDAGAGTFTIAGRDFRYVAERDAILEMRAGANFNSDDAGVITISGGDPLAPGYRVGVGFTNFERALEDNVDLEALSNGQLGQAFGGPLITIFIWTIIFAFFSVFTTFALGLFMAIIMQDADIPGKKIIRSMLIIPYAIPGVIAIVVWKGMLNTNIGIVNEMLSAITGTVVEIPWLNETWPARFSILLVNLWLGYPYMMLICSGALSAIPSDIYEAAAVDGASPWERFWQITLPLLLVTVGPLLIASFVFNFNNYLLIEALTAGSPPIPTSDRPAGYTDILISYVYRLAFGSNRGADYGYASAITILIFFITAAITLFQYRFTKTWEEVGENV